MSMGIQVLVLALILLGAVLRLYNLGGQGLWGDEMFTLLMASGDAGSQLGSCFRRECDGNPIVMDVEQFRNFLDGGMAVRPIAVVQDVLRYEPSHPHLNYIVAHLSLAAFGASE